MCASQLAESDYAQQLQQAELLCKEQGKRFTTVRRQVFSIILRNGTCSKAYDVLDSLLKVQPNAKPVTVYRSLEFLEEAGLIHRLSGLNAWIACCHIGQHCGKHPEVLAVCAECGMVTEIDMPEIHTVIDRAVSQHGLKCLDKQIEVQVSCTKCGSPCRR